MGQDSILLCFLHFSLLAQALLRSSKSQGRDHH